MRFLATQEARKRGCKYCADSLYHDHNWFGMSKYACNHEACPYHVLDNADNYLEWLKETTPKKKPGSGKRLMYL